jgi:UDP-N-acetylglucosamine 2-epimerase
MRDKAKIRVLIIKPIDYLAFLKHFYVMLKLMFTDSEGIIQKEAYITLRYNTERPKN